MNKLFSNTKKSFALVEMLVAIAIFMITMVAVTSLSISAIRSQKFILANQELFSQSTYAFEYISRALKMATKDGGNECVLDDWYESPYGTSSVRFLNHNRLCQEFYLDPAGILKERRSDTNRYEDFLDPTDLTSSHLKINSLVFYIYNYEQPGAALDRVTMMLDIETTKLVDPPQFRIQASMSPRNLERWLPL